MNWAYKWREWFPKPPDELVLLRAKARKLTGENRRLRSERDRARSEAARSAEQIVDAERRVENAGHGMRERESDIALLERERDKLLLILKRQDSREEHEAAMKLIDIEAAKNRVKYQQELNGERA